MRIFKKLLTLLVAICISQMVKANNGDNGENKSTEVCLQGCITDAITRKPVTGVTVSVSSNKLRTGKELQSDAVGYFNFDKLPPGDLTVMFAKKGYKLFRSDLLSVKEGSITKVAVDFQPVEEDDNEMWHLLLKLLD